MAACLFARAPQSPQDLLKEAEDAQQAGNLDRAVTAYQSIVENYPNIPEIRSNLGAALSGLGRYSEAIAQYKIALQLKPDPLVRLNLALAYYKTGDLTSAVEALKKVRAATTANTQAVTLLADCYLRLGKNKEVIALLTASDIASANNLAFDYLLGSALIRDGQLEKGQPIIDRILRNGDSAEAHFLMGATRYMAGELPAALADLKKAVELNPKLPDLYAYYGLALLGTGDEAAAEKAFATELQTNPGNFESNLRLGALLRQDSQNDQALKYLTQALRIRPGDPGVRYQIASLELSVGQTTQARRDLESLVKDQPQFLEAHVSLATVYYREGNKAAGIRERGVVARLNQERRATNEIAAKPNP